MGVKIKLKHFDDQLEMSYKTFNEIRATVASTIDTALGQIYEENLDLLKAGLFDNTIEWRIEDACENRDLDKDVMGFLLQRSDRGEIDAVTCKKILDLIGGVDLPQSVDGFFRKILKTGYECKQAVIWF